MKINMLVKKIKFTLKKNAPTIMVVAGAAGAVTATVMACKATLKLEETVDDCKAKIDEINASYIPENDHEIEEEKAYKKDITVQTIKNGVAVAKLYAPSALVGIASLSLIFGSNHIMQKRNLSLAAAYATLDTMFKKYRKNVKETFGEEVDIDMRYGIRHEKVEETIVDENGKEKKTKTIANIMDDKMDSLSDYSRFFDPSCRAWEDSYEYNIGFLSACESYCNNLLKANGYLFLNQVYKELGMEPSIAGQSVGWVYDFNGEQVGDGYVDFGITNVRLGADKDPVILLDFNVDGDILNNPLLKMGKF